MKPESSITLLAIVFALALAGCGDKSAPPASTAPAAVSPAPIAPAAQPTPALAAPPPTAAMPAPAAAAAPKQVALSVQGVASAGLTVRVKNIELGEDATVLTVSASFGSRETNFTNLAETVTYLADPAGNRLMLRPPEDNRYLRIVSGDTMEGKLVFLGAVPPGTPQLRLVFNEGNTPDNTAGPGLSITLPLQQGGT
ncbi:hypothetical protein QTH89_21680 [Variovorax sp. J22G21]|uniref:hypothetical protein n=1 Tax=Variovorax fucosicus TaxID=3053517 RepID=UPI002576C95D|nr:MULTISPECIES: hypothetical protein [unclassified Variovorax]MDM0039060.1 hypothetical protein [Variovorax sp. J22R193]MDM0063836.1 hypothetical protein [Variovorax sp. J22G21]